jgi:hypothetical protein
MQPTGRRGAELRAGGTFRCCLKGSVSLCGCRHDCLQLMRMSLGSPTYHIASRNCAVRGRGRDRCRHRTAGDTGYQAEWRSTSIAECDSAASWRAHRAGTSQPLLGWASALYWPCRLASGRRLRTVDPERRGGAGGRCLAIPRAAGPIPLGGWVDPCNEPCAGLRLGVTAIPSPVWVSCLTRACSRQAGVGRRSPRARSSSKPG